MILDLRKIFANEIENCPFHYEFDLSSTEISGSHPFVSPIKAEGKVEGKDGFAFLKARVSFQFSIPCDRCAEQIHRRYEYDFSHILVESLQNEEDDRYIEVKNGRLDLDRLLREDILLELPTRFLCRPDCRGICPVCGKNRNYGPCDCEKRSVERKHPVLHLVQ